jgi:hypothetical protein
MASHHLLTSRWPRSDLLVDRDVPPVEFDRHDAQNMFGPRINPDQSQGMATPPAATTPPCTPNARTHPARRARSGRSLGMTWLQPRPHQSFGGFGFSFMELSIVLAGSREGFRWGTDGVTPSVSASAPPVFKHLNRVALETATNVGPLTSIGGGRGEFAVKLSLSRPLPQSQRGDGERTIAHVTEAAGPPHSIFTQRRHRHKPNARGSSARFQPPPGGDAA